MVQVDFTCLGNVELEKVTLNHIFDCLESTFEVEHVNHWYKRGLLMLKYCYKETTKAPRGNLVAVPREYLVAVKDLRKEDSMDKISDDDDLLEQETWKKILPPCEIFQVMGASVYFVSFNLSLKQGEWLEPMPLAPTDSILGMIKKSGKIPTTEVVLNQELLSEVLVSPGGIELDYIELDYKMLVQRPILSGSDSVVQEKPLKRRKLDSYEAILQPHNGLVGLWVKISNNKEGYEGRKLLENVEWDLGTPWIYSTSHSDFANELRKAESVTKNGVMHIPMKNFLQSTESDEPSLIVSSLAQKLWGSLYKDTWKNRKVLVVGNPGIGKSRSLIYFLRLCLQKNETVIFESRRDKILWAFIPPPENSEETDYRVYAVRKKSFNQITCSLVHRKETFFLVDTASNKGVNIGFVCRVVMVSSPDERNFLDYSKHQTTKYLLPVWSKAEFNQFRIFWNEDINANRSRYAYDKLPKQEFDRRVLHVGPVPRYIFSSYADHHDRIVAGLKSIPFDTVVNLIENPQDLSQSAADNKVHSCLIHMYLHEHPEVLEDFFLRKSQTKLASDFVLVKLFERCISEIMSMMNPKRNHNANHSALGFFLEYIAEVILTMKVKLRYVKLPNQKRKQQKDPPSWLDLPDSKFYHFERTKAMFSKCKELLDNPDGKRYILSGPKCLPAFDFIEVHSGKFRLYQVTKSDSHPIKVLYVWSFLKAIGKLECIDGQYFPSEDFEFHFVVPQFRSTTFKRQSLVCSKSPNLAVDKDFDPQKIAQIKEKLKQKNLPKKAKEKYMKQKECLQNRMKDAVNWLEKGPKNKVGMQQCKLILPSTISELIPFGDVDTSEEDGEENGEEDGEGDTSGSKVFATFIERMKLIYGLTQGS